MDIIKTSTKILALVAALLGFSVNLAVANGNGRMDRLLVALVQFRDTKQAPYSKELAEKVLLGDAVNFYSEVSYGKQKLSGEVFDWRTIDADETCDTDVILKKSVEALGKDKAVDFSRFGRLVLLFPNAGCDWGGMGTVGLWNIQTPKGKMDYSVSWIPGRPTLRVVAHELGHNLSLNHASLLSCGKEELNDDTSKCEDLEYDDPSDAMGGADPRHFSAYHKHLLGWITDKQFPTVKAKDGVYTYWLNSLETKNGLKGIRVPIDPGHSVEPNARQSEFIIEFRQPIGYDKGLFSSKEDYDGALVHIPLKTEHQKSTFLHTHLLDMSPGEPGYTLKAGHSWTAPNGKVAIKAKKVQDGRLIVEIMITGAGGGNDKKGLFARLWDTASDVVQGIGGGVTALAQHIFGIKPGSTQIVDVSMPADEHDDIIVTPDGKGRIHKDPIEPNLDTTQMVSAGEGVTPLAAVPAAQAAAEPAAAATLCSSRALPKDIRTAYGNVFSSESQLHHLPSPLRERYDAVAAKIGISESPVACLTPGEHLAHILAGRRLRQGDVNGAANAFTWDSLAAAHEAHRQLLAFNNVE